DVENVFKSINKNPDFERIPTYYFASNTTGKKMLEKEYEVRKKAGLPIKYLNREQVKKNLGIEAPAALFNDTSAQLDCYKGATYLLDYHVKKKEKELYSHTLVTEYKKNKQGYRLTTENGPTIDCK